MVTKSVEERPPREQTAVAVAEFIFRHRCRDWAGVYVEALKLLEENALDQWTREDVIAAIMRAIRLLRENLPQE